MASITRGIFGGGIPWDFFFIGVGVAAAIIACDKILEWKKASFRMPVLAIAIGIYLPFDLATPIFVGGLVAYVAKRLLERRAPSGEPKAATESFVERRLARGVLFSSGLIAGESLFGILLAGLIVATGSPAPLALTSPPEYAYVFGVLVLLYICFVLGYSVVRRGKEESAAST